MLSPGREEGTRNVSRSGYDQFHFGTDCHCGADTPSKSQERQCGALLHSYLDSSSRWFVNKVRTAGDFRISPGPSLIYQTKFVFWGRTIRNRVLHYACVVALVSLLSPLLMPAQQVSPDLYS